jgi:hypothetical protein
MFFRRFYEICFTVCPKFMLLTDGRAGDLRNKQNCIEQHVPIWFMLQISDFCFDLTQQFGTEVVI